MIKKKILSVIKAVLLLVDVMTSYWYPEQHKAWLKPKAASVVTSLTAEEIVLKQGVTTVLCKKYCSLVTKYQMFNNPQKYAEVQEDCDNNMLEQHNKLISSSEVKSS